jgi:hypothetical protein
MKFIILIFILVSTSFTLAQPKKVQSNETKDSLKWKKANVDSLKIDVRISIRRNAASYKYYSKLSSQDSVNYKFPVDTLLGRVRMFKVTVNKKASMGNYKNSLIKEIRLEYKYKGSILKIEQEKLFRPEQSITIWNGKGNKKPNNIAKADQVVIILITKTNSKMIHSKYVVNF